MRMRGVRIALVSVIVPTSGRPAFLVEGIGSVLAQTFRQLELIVVDNGCPIPAVLPDDPRLRLVRRDTDL